MRSALTHALSSKGVATQPPAPQLQDDTFSFPCLNDGGAQEDTSVQSLTQSFERFDIRKGTSLPGSARVRRSTHTVVNCC